MKITVDAGEFCRCGFLSSVDLYIVDGRVLMCSVNRRSTFLKSYS